MDAFVYDEVAAIESTHWWSVGMRGVFHDLLERALAGVASPRLLDVGCGTGIAMQEFARHGRVVGIDRARAALAYTRQRDPGLAVAQADLTRLPIAPARFDAVVALDVIEHVADDRAALAEIRRILTPSGILLCNVPAFPSLWSDKDTAAHHHRRYRKQTLRAAIEGAGFRIERLTYTNAALFPAIWLIRQVQRAARRPWNARGEYHPSAVVNRALARLLLVEQMIVRRRDLPFGTSVTALARRDG